MAKGFELEGKLHLINDIQSFDSGFTKREFVVEVSDGNYPQMIKFECVRERTSLTDGFQVGDGVRVYFDIRGNEYQGRYFVNLNAWKLETSSGSGGGGQSQSSASSDGGFSNDSAPPAGVPKSSPAGSAEEDDIPF